MDMSLVLIPFHTEVSDFHEIFTHDFRRVGGW